MAGFRQNAENEVLVQAEYDTAYKACVHAAERVGKVKQESKTLGHISVNVPMKMFPPRNPVNLKISVMSKDNGCLIKCVADCFDGAIGFGSAPKAIDSFYEILASYLD